MVIEPKIWQNFKTLADFRPTIRGCRRCRSNCNDCGQRWDETGTEHVHMVVSLIDGKQKTTYICTNCLNKNYSQ